MLVILKHEHVSEQPRRFVGAQIAGPSLSFLLSRTGWGPRICKSKTFPGNVDPETVVQELHFENHCLVFLETHASSLSYEKHLLLG